MNMHWQWARAWRFYVLASVLGVLLVALAARIVMLQIIDTEQGYRFLQQQGDARAVRTSQIPARRGMLLDRHGEALAVSTQVFALWFDPRLLEANADEEARLASLLGLDEQRLSSKIAGAGNSRFVYLRRQVRPDVANEVLQLGIKGVYAEREFKRYYPAGEVTSHILGFTGIDGQGQEGMELALERSLAAEAGAKQVVKDLHGRTIGELKEIKPAQPGQDISLSLDLRLQHIAYSVLKDAVAATGGSAGSIVIVDVATAEVLALANQPSYNPNNRRGLQSSVLRNRAITDAFEPGSTVKPFTMLAALESGKYHPGSVIDTTPGHIMVDGKLLADPRNYGELSLSRIITKSSQVGTSKLALTLDPLSVREAFYRVGLGQVPGTGFPGEVVGVLPERRHWRDIERANFAYGYGLTVSPLQLAQAYTTIASGGQHRSLSLLLDGAGEASQVMSTDMATQLMKMLATVVQKGGTAERAKIPAYSLAGKTGTVHQAAKGGYSEDRYFSSFAGMAPATNPRVVGVVVINDPKRGQYTGGQVAAPVFAKFVSQALPLLNATPDKPEDYSGRSRLVGI